MSRALAATSLFSLLLFSGHQALSFLASKVGLSVYLFWLIYGLLLLAFLYASRTQAAAVPRAHRDLASWPLAALVTLPASLRRLSIRLQRSGPKGESGVPALRHFVWLLEGAAGSLEWLLEPLAPPLPSASAERLKLLAAVQKPVKGPAVSLALLGPLPEGRRSNLLDRARLLGWNEPESLERWAEQKTRCQQLFQPPARFAAILVGLGGAAGVTGFLIYKFWAGPLLGAGCGWLLARLVYWWPSATAEGGLAEAAGVSLSRRRPVAVEVAARCEKIGQRSGIRVGESWVETRPPLRFEGEGRLRGYLEGGPAVCWWGSLRTDSGTRRAFPRARALVSPLFICLLGGCWAVLQWVEP